MKLFLRGHAKIFVAQERLNRMFGFRAIIRKGGLLGHKTVSTGSFDACAVRDYFTLIFALHQPLLSARYCMIYCCSAYRFSGT